ncbi:MAG: carbohydrate-binding domain-containing protein [Lachnospiraceae bacterium]|nr:carbohydrate-binding domain-containing protein [Lachnospiraceae bacterium]
MKYNYLKRKVIVAVAVIAVAGFTFTGCKTDSSDTQTTQTESQTDTEDTTTESEDSSEMFSDRDLEQEADLTDAQYITVSDGEDITLSEEGVYVLSGTATDVTVYVENEEAKIQIVLDGVSITNSDSPAIYVKAADKVFITTTEGSENTLEVTGEYTADGDTNLDAVIFSKDDITLNGLGTLTLITSQGNGISGKDDVVITGGTYVIEAGKHGIEAKDLVAINDGTFTITSTKDGIQANNDEDDTVGAIYIAGGDYTINAGDDGIRATTTLTIDGGTFDISAVEGLEATNITINDGTIDIYATDDGINTTSKSTAYDVVTTINGGDINIEMGQGDTDAIDSNGDIYINGGNINITANSPFDYDGQGELNGGTLTVNGQQTTELQNQMMGGAMGNMAPGQMGDQSTTGTQSQMSGQGMMSGQAPSGGQGPMGGQGPF